jgi:hypothetical protein
MSLTISWDAGFFSCCSVKLYKLVEYVNQEKELPRSTDESELFTLYKPEQYQHQDITDHFFTKKPWCSIDYSGSYIDPVSLTLEQFQPYSAIQFNVLKPFVDHSFSCSQTLLDLQSALLEKYAIDVSNTCAIYFRGSDKRIETILGSFESYAHKMRDIVAVQPDIQFILQSDCYEFVKYMVTYATTLNIQNNIIIIEENIVTSGIYGLHYTREGEKAYNDIKYLLATVTILARCKHIVCSSGNVSFWMMLFRGNAHNVHQSLHGAWV